MNKQLKHFLSGDFLFQIFGMSHIFVDSLCRKSAQRSIFSVGDFSFCNLLFPKINIFGHSYRTHTHTHTHTHTQHSKGIAIDIAVALKKTAKVTLFSQIKQVL